MRYRNRATAAMADRVFAVLSASRVTSYARWLSDCDSLREACRYQTDYALGHSDLDRLIEMVRTRLKRAIAEDKARGYSLQALI